MQAKQLSSTSCKFLLIYFKQLYFHSSLSVSQMAKHKFKLDEKYFCAHFLFHKEFSIIWSIYVVQRVIIFSHLSECLDNFNGLWVHKFELGTTYKFV